MNEHYQDIKLSDVANVVDDQFKIDAFPIMVQILYNANVTFQTIENESSNTFVTDEECRKTLWDLRSWGRVVRNMKIPITYRKWIHEDNQITLKHIDKSSILSLIEEFREQAVNNLLEWKKRVNAEMRAKMEANASNEHMAVIRQKQKIDDLLFRIHILKKYGNDPADNPDWERNKEEVKKNEVQSVQA